MENTKRFFHYKTEAQQLFIRFSILGLGFLLGLLINCFVLSALFIKTNSLWICVMTHALINVFSQLAIDGNQYVSYVSKIVIIVMAVVISGRGQNKKGLMCSL